MTPADIALRRSATKVLTHHKPSDPAKVLEEMMQSPYARLQTDFYGEGGAVEALEHRVATLLGKPAGMLFIKGVIAQHCLLRVRAEERRSLAVAIHPLSHIDYDEANGVERLHGLQPVRLGRHAPFKATDLAAGPDLACVVVELPLRRAAYLLPDWDELLAFTVHRGRPAGGAIPPTRGSDVATPGARRTHDDAGPGRAHFSPGCGQATGKARPQQK